MIHQASTNGPRFVVARSICLAICFFSFGGIANARDTSLVLADGDRISGTLVEATAHHVVLITTHSGRVEVARSFVERIESTRDVSVVLNNDERLIGRLLSQESGRIFIASPTLGEHAIALALIASITPYVEAADTTHIASLAEIRGKGEDNSTSNPALIPPSSTKSKASKPIGRPEDEEDIRKLFLRQSSVLLAPGQYEFEAGIEYNRTRSSTPSLDTTSRVLSLPLGLRVGLVDRWQGYVNLPLAYGQKQFSTGIDEISFRQSGVGDVSAGLNYQVVQEGRSRPDIVVTTSVSVPTGRSPYTDGGTGVALGTGHWSANMGLQFVKTEDPVAIFGGLNYTYQFARNGLGKRIKLGNALGYNLGLGFAINDRVSVSGEFIGSVQGVTREDGVRMVGTTREPMQFRTGLIYRVSRDWYLAPTVTYSLNTDAPDVIIGVSTSHQFQ